MGYKEIVNYVGTPLMGLAVGGIPGLLISYAPDVPYVKMLLEDAVKGKNKDRLTGYTLKARDVSHSLLVPAALWATVPLGMPWEVPAIYTGHLLIDYATHGKEKYFKKFKPIYPLSRREI
jgi:hypothetical protein